MEVLWGMLMLPFQESKVNLQKRQRSLLHLTLPSCHSGPVCASVQPSVPTSKYQTDGAIRANSAPSILHCLIGAFHFLFLFVVLLHQLQMPFTPWEGRFSQGYYRRWKWTRCGSAGGYCVCLFFLTDFEMFCWACSKKANMITDVGPASP